MSKTLIGITSYGGLPFLKLALGSIRATTTTPVVVVVIVAKPGDDEMFDFVSSRGLLAMPHEINRGFPASCNDLFDIAFRKEDFDNLIIMGNDVVAMPGAIDALINCADITDYDMICGSEFDSRFLVANYPEARQFFHGPNNDFTDFTARPWELHKDFREGIEPGALKDVRNFTLYKRRVFDVVGYADANFWPNGYFEDNDYALRCNHAGIRACGLKEAAFFHFWSRTIHQGEARPNNVFFERNKIHYIHKWGGGVGQETYRIPYREGDYELAPGLVLPGTLKISDRSQEAAIIQHWSTR